MLLLDGIVLGLIVGLLTKGSLRNAAKAHLKAEGLLVILFVLQLGWPYVARFTGSGKYEFLYAWLTIMAGLVLAALANWRYHGMRLMALGIAGNLLVIALNGAMPVSLEVAATVAGTSEIATREWGPLHEPLADTTHAQWLADVIPLPGPKWHRAVVSIGDIVLALGAALFVVEGLHARSLDARTGGRPDDDY